MVAPKTPAPAPGGGGVGVRSPRDLYFPPSAVEAGATALGLRKRASGKRLALWQACAALRPRRRQKVAGAGAATLQAVPWWNQGSRPRGTRWVFPSLRDGTRDGVVRINFVRNCQVSQDACGLEPKARPCRESGAEAKPGHARSKRDGKCRKDKRPGFAGRVMARVLDESSETK